MGKIINDVIYLAIIIKLKHDRIVGLFVTAFPYLISAFSFLLEVFTTFFKKKLSLFSQKLCIIATSFVNILVLGPKGIIFHLPNAVRQRKKKNCEANFLYGSLHWVHATWGATQDLWSKSQIFLLFPLKLSLLFFKKKPRHLIISYISRRFPSTFQHRNLSQG